MRVGEGRGTPRQSPNRSAEDQGEGSPASLCGPRGVPCTSHAASARLCTGGMLAVRTDVWRGLVVVMLHYPSRRPLSVACFSRSSHRTHVEITSVLYRLASWEAPTGEPAGHALVAGAEVATAAAVAVAEARVVGSDQWLPQVSADPLCGDSGSWRPEGGSGRRARAASTRGLDYWAFGRSGRKKCQALGNREGAGARGAFLGTGCRTRVACSATWRPGWWCRQRLSSEKRLRLPTPLWSDVECARASVRWMLQVCRRLCL